MTLFFFFFPQRVEPITALFPLFSHLRISGRHLICGSKQAERLTITNFFYWTQAEWKWGVKIQVRVSSKWFVLFLLIKTKERVVCMNTFNKWRCNWRLFIFRSCGRKASKFLTAPREPSVWTIGLDSELSKYFCLLRCCFSGLLDCFVLPKWDWLTRKTTSLVDWLVGWLQLVSTSQGVNQWMKLVHCNNVT